MLLTLRLFPNTNAVLFAMRSASPAPKVPRSERLVESACSIYVFTFDNTMSHNIREFLRVEVCMLNARPSAEEKVIHTLQETHARTHTLTPSLLPVSAYKRNRMTGGVCLEARRIGLPSGRV